MFSKIECVVVLTTLVFVQKFTLSESITRCESENCKDRISRLDDKVVGIVTNDVIASQHRNPCGFFRKYWNEFSEERKLTYIGYTDCLVNKSVVVNVTTTTTTQKPEIVTQIVVVPRTSVNASSNSTVQNHQTVHFPSDDIVRNVNEERSVTRNTGEHLENKNDTKECVKCTNLSTSTITCQTVDLRGYQYKACHCKWGRIYDIHTRRYTYQSGDHVSRITKAGGVIYFLEGLHCCFPPLDDVIEGRLPRPSVFCSDNV